jgi:hypothetical protein
MSSRQEILARFSGEARRGVLYLPDLSLWYEWHHSRGTLPDGWETYSLPQVARAMGVPIWLAVFPGRVETPGVEMVTTEADDERVITAQTSSGDLVARWTLGPDGDWWQTEYPVKRREDLQAVLELARARTYVLDLAELERYAAEVGEDGILALEIPRRPYSDLLHQYLGWSEGLLFLREPVIDEIIGTLEQKLQRFVQQVAGHPVDLVLSPDNLDGQFISPRAFEQYLGASYRVTTEVLAASGKRLVVHVGGPIRRLLPLLADAHVDGLEGVAGPPQSDVSLAQAREEVGPALTLWGGIPQDFLPDTRDREQLEAAVARAVRETRGDPRVMIGVADRVPVDAEWSRLQSIPQLIEQAFKA